MFDLTISLVLYRNPPDMIARLLADLAATRLRLKIWLVDNSPTAELMLVAQQTYGVNLVQQYWWTGDNLGFGRAHNLAFFQGAQHQAEHHLVINPDVRLRPEVLPALLAAMDELPGVSLLAPAVCYPDGQRQASAKLLPTPFDLLARRFLPRRVQSWRWSQRYELYRQPLHTPLDTPQLSGCMLLMRQSALIAVQGFDPQYFMYLEDTDLVRRLRAHGPTVYWPYCQVEHAHGRGSYQSWRLLGHHLRSAWLYFNRWGWLRDPERRQRNQQCLQALADKHQQGYLQARLSGAELESTQLPTTMGLTEASAEAGAACGTASSTPKTRLDQN